MRPGQSVGLLALFAMLAVGCAGSAGTARPVGPSMLAQVPDGHSLGVRVDAKPDLVVTSNAKERILLLISKHLRESFPGRFENVSALTPASSLEASVMIKRYDEGNAFARAMLAGLGQMHIDADVVMRDVRTGQVLGSFEVTKTFAWGGVYGAATRIDDIEDGFAAAVAEAIAKRGQ